jgi:mRNA interferase MazF
MPITFGPHQGTVLICDFRTGFVPPEMVKRRPVVVIAPRAGTQKPLYIVVPFSTVAPLDIKRFHIRLPAGKYWFLNRMIDTWAKCDTLTSVAHTRLDRMFVNGRWITPTLSDGDFRAIQSGVLHALGLSRLTAQL